jgi:hypothetical protein
MDAPMPNRLPVFFVLLLLSGLLLAAAGAQGASAGPIASPSALEEDFEGLEEELEEEESEEEAVEAECETAREEASEGELGPDEVDEICAEVAEAGRRRKSSGKKSAVSGSVAPEECLLRSAQAHAAVNAAGDKLKLTIGYTAYESVAATVEVRKGSSRIATKRLQLGRSGVLRIVKGLGNAKPPKLVVIRLAVATSPSYCGKYETEKVRVR